MNNISYPSSRSAHMQQLPEFESFVADVLKTIQKYRLIRDGDKVGVAVSGGGDSLCLLRVLAEINRSAAVQFQIFPVYINQYERRDEIVRLRSYIEENFDLKLTVVTANTVNAAYSLINDGKSPCRVCSKVRADSFVSAARALELTVVALGHHLDDVVATLLMNMAHRGEIDTMRPKTFRRGHGFPTVRPFYFTPEWIVKSYSPNGPEGLFDCGVCSISSSERERNRSFVGDTFRFHPPSVSYYRSIIENEILCRGHADANSSLRKRSFRKNNSSKKDRAKVGG